MKLFCIPVDDGRVQVFTSTNQPYPIFNTGTGDHSFYVDHPTHRTVYSMFCPVPIRVLDRTAHPDHSSILRVVPGTCSDIRIWCEHWKFPLLSFMGGGSPH